MNKAQRRAVEFRRKLGLRGQVDAEGVAGMLGFEVIPWALQAQEEDAHRPLHVHRRRPGA